VRKQRDGLRLVGFVPFTGSTLRFSGPMGLARLSGLVSGQAGRGLIFDCPDSDGRVALLWDIYAIMVAVLQVCL
jgi:hypothetical protein